MKIPQNGYVLKIPAKQNTVIFLFDLFERIQLSDLCLLSPYSCINSAFKRFRK